MVSSVKLRRQVLALSLMVGIAVVGTFALWAERERSAAFDAARTEVMNSSQLLAQAIDGTFSGIDKVLAGIDVSYRLLGDGTEDMLGLLRRQMPLITQARGLLIIGADGFSRYATNLPLPMGRVDLSDRDYFRAHLETAGRTYVSGPLKSRNDGAWIMVVSRSLTGPRGEFLGVVAATLSFESLSRELRGAMNDPRMAALLVDSLGTVLVRIPDPGGATGTSISDLAAFRRAVGERRGGGITLSPFDDRERIFGFARSNDFPLLTIVSMDSGQVLTGWAQHMIVPGLLVMVLLLLIGLLVSRLQAQLRKLERTQELLMAAQAAAAVAAETKSAFVTHASHELRTPLTTIIGFADSLIHSGSGQACQARCREYLGYISASGRHLQAVINDLLDLTRIEGGSLAIERAPVDLVTVIRETLRAAADQAGRREVALANIGLDQPLRVDGDNLRLRQMLFNLVSEAIRMSPKGGTVTVSLAPGAEGFAVISVADQGAGMAGSDLQLARAPLGRAPLQASRPGEGTGLALPLADQLARLHGGRLDIVSRTGEGTTATVILPLGNF
jgi:two-component system cell cycle sensor histidine kinase PleC